MKGMPVNHITTNIVTIAPNELLKGRKALVTGGTSGIGYAIASAFLRSGAYVTTTGRTEHRLDDSIKKLAEENPSAKDRISFVVMDNKEVGSFKTLFEENKDVNLIFDTDVVNPETFAELANKFMTSKRTCFVVPNPNYSASEAIEGFGLHEKIDNGKVLTFSSDDLIW